MSERRAIHDITTCQAHHGLPDGEVELLGAIDTVTGSMTRLCTGGARLLVDCGVAQGREARRWRFPEAARDVDAVLLTHGHNDHVGSLPTLFEGGFDGPLFATPETLGIVDIVLRDGVRLSGGSERDVARVRRRLRELGRPVPYDTPCTPAGFDGQVWFRDAGHILGSSSIELRSASSRVIMSGDLGRPHSPLLRDYCERWEQDRAVDLVVMETTYGDAEHRQDHADIERKLEAVVKRALEDGGHILVPAFAIGRTQTLLYHLNTLVESGRLPDVPVAVDTPMGLRVTELFGRARHLFDVDAQAKLRRGDDPLEFEGLYAVNRGKDSARLRDVEQPMIILAGSGMCTGGRIVGHLRELLPRPETCVLFVGYQAHGTPGRAILQAARAGEREGRMQHVELDGSRVPVRAAVETLGGLSAHADRRELSRWLHGLPETKRLALNHGEPEAQRGMLELVEATG